MYAGRGLWGMWRESKKSQAMMLPPPVEITEHDTGGNGSGVVEA
jgi:hypothetical protein